MTNRGSSLFKFVCFGTLMAGSLNCGPSWHVMRQANPNPFRNGATFSLQGLDTSAMTIDGEPAASWYQHHPGEDAATVPGDINGAAPHFGEHAATHSHGSLSAAAAPFSVRARLVSWTRGSYSVWVAHPTNVVVDAQILDSAGQVLDEVRFERVVSHPLYRPTSVQGLNTALEECGDDLGDYLSQRRTSFRVLRRNVATVGHANTL